MQKSYDLVVGSLDSGGDGVLRIYDGRQSDGDFSTVKPVIYRGFKEIKDVTYKESIY